MTRQADIARVVADLGLGELQAIRHIRSRAVARGNHERRRRAEARAAIMQEIRP